MKLAAKIPVCVFAKPPVAGRVKTRLAAAIGADAAAELAGAMLCDVWNTLLSIPECEPVLASSEPGVFPISSELQWLQGEGDLGARLERVLRNGIELSGCAIAIGADSPLLERGHVVRAIEYLTSYDAVIGPAFDGGYYLLGLRRCPVSLLSGLSWSTAETGRRTIERLRDSGFSVQLLDPLRDVDVAEDLPGLIDELGSSEATAHQTREWLTRYRPVLRGLPVG